MNILNLFFLLINGNSNRNIPPNSNQPSQSQVVQTELETPQYETPILKQGLGVGNNQGVDRRRGVSLSFTPSQIPAVQNIPSSVNVGNTVVREHLRIGGSRLLEGCDVVDTRIPCNKPNQRINENQCNRWKCCWDATDPVRCAHNKYYFTRFRTSPKEFGTCGFPLSALDENLIPAPLPFVIALINGRILGGTPAPINEFPWMVYIYILQQGFPQGGICGGTLLNERWIVTAAHCFETPIASLFGVILGEHQLSVTTGDEIFRNVMQLIIHPDFQFSQRNNDIALVKMDRPVPESLMARPLCVIPQGTRVDNLNLPTLAGRICVTLGWGITENGGPTADTLLQLSVVINPRIACTSTTAGNVGLYTNLPVFDSQPKFCAGGVANEDTCMGDSGGPLMCLNAGGFYELVGITSYGTTPCGLNQLPGVFTDVSQFGDWITNTIAANS